MSRFGALIRDRRRQVGLSQQQLAEVAAVSVGMLRDLEQDRTTRPRRASVQRLRAALDLSSHQSGEDAEPADGAVKLGVLGPLRAWRGGVPVQLGGVRPRAVLGLLSLQPNVVLHRDSIIETIWAADPPSSAVKMVQAYVAHLRRQLDPGCSPHDRDGFLVSVGAHYRLQASAEQLDLIAFRQLCERAQAARRSGDAAVACEIYAEALGLWQGEPLADLDLLSGHPAVVSLGRGRATVVNDFAETAIGAGLPDRALPYLEWLVERDPLDERAHAWLMIALAGTGQQAAALSLYGRLRQRLDDQLGVRPGPALVQAHARVLRQDVPAIFPSPLRPTARMPAAPPRQLPRGPDTFVGREGEYSALESLAKQADGTAPICVIDGVAGVGKTALAIHAGWRLETLFPDGQLYADLRGFGPHHRSMAPDEALAGFLRALGVAPPAVPSGLDEQAAMYRSLLAGRHMLIILDNAADAAQVRPLLPGSPGLLVLVTSRGRLSGLTARDDAVRITLGPLAPDQAILLLGKIIGHERVSADQQAAADISARCGLLPLALRIAADRAAARPRMTLTDLADQLTAMHARLDVLDLGDEDATAVRAVFSWSYKALGPETARMFRLLGLHTGPDISIPAAAALAAIEEAEASRLLALLADAHLIEESLASRFRLHDLLHAYAAEQAGLDESAHERGSAIRRVLTWYLHTADHADQLLVPGRRRAPTGSAPPGVEPVKLGGYEQAVAWCDAEQANLTAAARLAASIGHDDLAWKFSVALRGFFDLRRPSADWLACAEIAVDAAFRAGDLRGQAWALDCLGHAYSSLGRFEDALDCYTQARSLRRESGDQWGESANSMNNLGCVYLDLRKPDLALECFLQVLAVSRDRGSKYVTGLALINLGKTYSLLDRPDDALAYLLQARNVTRDIGYRQAEGITLRYLGDIYRVMQRPGKARRCYCQALAIRRQAGDRHGEAETLRDLGDLANSVSRIEAAHQAWRHALAIANDLGDPRAVAEIRSRLDRPPSDLICPDNRHHRRREPRYGTVAVIAALAHHTSVPLQVSSRTIRWLRLFCS